MELIMLGGNILTMDGKRTRAQALAIEGSKIIAIGNNNEIANVKAMCKAWNNSKLNGDERIKEAIEAYKARDQFTKTFIAKYYRLVLFDIESLLHPSEQAKFNDYMNDRRRRMASSGARSWGSVVENVKSGRDAVSFHCRRDRE